MRSSISRILQQTFSVAIAASCFLVAQSARTQQPAPAAPVDYQAMLKSGANQFEKGDYVAAIGTWERLLQSIGEARGWKVLYNLGLAYEAVGDATYAMDRYVAFLRNVDTSAEPAAEDIAERKSDALERMNRIRASHGQVRVRPAPGAIVLVRIDSGPERPAGFTAWLLPGDHGIDVGCGTDTVRHLTIRVEAGQSSEVLTGEPPVPPARPAAATPAPRRPAPVVAPRPWPFPTAWVLAGAGATVASAALPIALGLRAHDKREEAISLGLGNTGYPAANDQYESARRAYYISYVLPASLVATTLGIAGFHWLSTGGARPIRAAATISPDGGRLWAFGTF